MKNKFTFFIKLILFLALLGWLLCGYANLVEYKESKIHKMPLFEQAEDIDVLLLGSSHMQDNIYPMTLWENFGITAYNAGSSGEPLEITYFVLKELLKSVKPKVAVVDLYMAHSRKEGFDQNQGLVHGSIDFMQRDEVRAEVANKMGQAQGMEPLSFMSNIYAYHTRWKELTKEDFDPKYSLEKGAVMLSGIYTHKKPEIFEESYDEDMLDSVGFTYLDKIIELCKENNIKVVVTNLPNVGYTQKKQLMTDTCLTKAKELGAYTLDIARASDDIGIDYSCDFRDDDGHLNIVGSKKATDYLGDYLVSNFEISDHRGDAEIADRWNADLAAYRESKLAKAKVETNAISAIMYAYNEPNFKVRVFGDSAVALQDPSFSKLMSIMELEVLARDSMSDAEKDYLLTLRGEDKSDLVVFIERAGEEIPEYCGCFTFKEAVFKINE